MDLTNYMPVPGTGCWLWLGKWNKGGYGIVGDDLYAHRESYRATHGSIPAGHFICHKCDTRACINPDHLYAGTNRDNTNDRVRRGRSSGGRLAGERNPSAKLTRDQAIAILDSSDPARIVAAKYGVSAALVGHIRTGRKWGQIMGQAASGGLSD